MSQLSDAHILNYISTSIPILIYRRVLLLLPLHSHSSTPDITCRTILPAGERLEKGICKDHIIIGTPGRVYDVVKKKNSGREPDEGVRAGRGRRDAEPGEPRGAGG